MATTSSEITDIIKAKIKGFEGGAESVDVGTVVEIGDGIARVYGLANCMASELLDFGNDVFGLAFNLEEDTVSAIILGDYTGIIEGGEVRTTGRIAETPVGDALVGRVVDPLGRALDGKGDIKTKDTRPVDVVAPGVIMRQNVDTPVQTGIKVIDSITPIGRGQRELIIGDRQTGKTAVAIDTIINQKGQNLICIYVAIGQKESSVAKIVATLEEKGAMDHTIVVIAGASDPATVQYLAPFAACAMGEFFRDSDSRLLERAARLNKDEGGGSLTALPIIETQANDISAYIPTNVISITDGQIYLETDLFNQGQRPAMNTGLSVSRVGGDAQTKAMKAVVRSLKLELAQYRELAAFAQFGSDLDKATQQQLRRGEKVTEIMKQPQYEPLSLEKEVVIIFAATNGFIDDVPKERVADYERDLYRFMDSVGKSVSAKIAKDKKWDAAIEKEVRSMLDEFKKTNTYTDEKAPAAASAGDKKPQAPAKPAAKTPAGAKA